MKIGICIAPDMLAAAKCAGFAYAELNISAVAAMEDDAFEALLVQVKSVGLPVEAMNVLLPGGITLLGAEATAAVELDAYLERAFARAEALGASTVVFGSGRARRRPEGMQEEEAQAALVPIARRMGDAAARHKLTIVVEPLNTKETNTINSIAEGAALVAGIAHTNVRLLADYYHMAVEKESMEAIKRLPAGTLCHAHIARGEGRTFPLSAAEDDYEGFFAALKSVGYDGRVSIEGGTQDFEQDAPRALAFLKSL